MCILNGGLGYKTGAERQLASIDWEPQGYVGFNSFL